MGKDGNSNPNLSAVRQAVRSLGGTIVRTVTGGRHLHVGIRTKLGAEFDMAINRGKVDPHKQIGWVRQRMRRADATLKKRK